MPAQTPRTIARADGRKSSPLGAAALALLLVVFFGLYASRIWDIDFWWHLATGRAIVAAGAIPQRDPFGIYGSVSAVGSTILRGYWLAQVVFYLVYRSLGAAGVIALKAGILTCSLLLVHRRSIGAGSHRAVAWVVTILAGWVLTSYTGERPQLASFLFAGVVFALLDRYEEGGRRGWLYAVPAVMLVWANCHGGVVLGAALLVVHAVARVAERRHAGTSEAARERNVFLAAIGLAVVLSFVSPVGWKTLTTVVALEANEMRSRISEYQSPFRLWREFGLVQFYPYAVLLGLSALSLPGLLRDRRLRGALMVLLLAALSTRAFRYVPFLPIVAGPYVAAGVTRLAGGALRRLPSLDAAVVAGSVVALLLGLRAGRMFQSGVDEGRFPTRAVEALRAIDERGRVLTSFEWAGYVIWNLPSGPRPYLDSRNLDLGAFDRYTHMIWATPQGLEALDREHFDYVLMPRQSLITHEPYALGPVLASDPRWRLVYQDPQALLFTAR